MRVRASLRLPDCSTVAGRRACVSNSGCLTSTVTSAESHQNIVPQLLPPK